MQHKRMADVPDNKLQDIKEVIGREDIKLTPEEVLTATTTKLSELKSCTAEDVRFLKEAAAKIIAKSALPVSTLLKPPLSTKWSRITFGCSALDKCTRGGIVTRGITEFCGASGAGKTQLLLQLSLTVQLPLELGGLGKGVAYICTEDVFPSKRLFQMAKTFSARFPEPDINYLGNIYIEHLIESEELLSCVIQRLAKLMASINIGLIVIDSVAAIFRLYTDYVERAHDMRKLANALLHYADKYNCGVICVNQVTSMGEGNVAVPCLGLSWAHLGRTRIRISKVPKQIKIKENLLTIRKLEIMYSPETPNDFAEFLITEEGVVDVIK